jgi:hypothetical protein
MKRCPQCLFIYPDADTRCDFDNTPLVVVDESELEAATAAKTPKKTTKKRATKKSKRKTSIVAAVIGLLLGVAAFFVYYSLTHHTQHTAQIQPIPIVNAEPLAAPIASPAALPAASPSLTATPTPMPRPTAERVATAHTSTTVAPISTSGPGMGKNGKPVILLTSGGKIDADEVWRTRDGVWYRRDGIVTLLKRGRVKAIVNQ